MALIPEDSNNEIYDDSNGDNDLKSREDALNTFLQKIEQRETTIRSNAPSISESHIDDLTIDDSGDGDGTLKVSGGTFDAQNKNGNQGLSGTAAL